MQKVYEIVYDEDEGVNKVEFKGTITLKRLNWDESNVLQSEAVNMQFVGRGIPSVTPDLAKGKLLAVWKSYVSSEIIKTTYFIDKVTKEIKPKEETYPITLETLKVIPQFLGDYLFDSYTELNTLTEKKKEQSEAR